MFHWQVISHISATPTYHHMLLFGRSIQGLLPFDAWAVYVRESAARGADDMGSATRSWPQSMWWALAEEVSEAEPDPFWWIMMNSMRCPVDVSVAASVGGWCDCRAGGCRCNCRSWPHCHWCVASVRKTGHDWAEQPRKAFWGYNGPFYGISNSISCQHQMALGSSAGWIPSTKFL